MLLAVEDVEVLLVVVLPDKVLLVVGPEPLVDVLLPAIPTHTYELATTLHCDGLVAER